MSAKHPKQQTPTFLLELPLQVEAGQAKRLRAHLEVGRHFYNAVLSRSDKSVCAVCAQMRRGRRRVPFLVHRSSNDGQRSLLCESDIGSRKPTCMRMRNKRASLFWLTIWMRCWRSGFRHAPIRRSTACAWARLAGCASKVEGAGSTASRTNVTIPIDRIDVIFDLSDPQS